MTGNEKDSDPVGTVSLVVVLVLAALLAMAVAIGPQKIVTAWDVLASHPIAESYPTSF